MPATPVGRSRIGMSWRVIPYLLAGEAAMLAMLWWDLDYPPVATLMAVLSRGWLLVGEFGAAIGLLAYVAVETVRLYRKLRIQEQQRRAEHLDLLSK